MQCCLFQEKQTESKNYEQKTKELHAVHQQELNIADERWRQCLEQQLAEAEVRHKEELMELSKEWHWERKVCSLLIAFRICHVGEGLESILQVLNTHNTSKCYFELTIEAHEGEQKCRYWQQHKTKFNH